MLQSGPRTKTNPQRRLIRRLGRCCVFTDRHIHARLDGGLQSGASLDGWWGYRRCLRLRRNWRHCAGWMPASDVNVICSHHERLRSYIKRHSDRAHASDREQGNRRYADLFHPGYQWRIYKRGAPTFTSFSVTLCCLTATFHGSPCKMLLLRTFRATLRVIALYSHRPVSACPSHTSVIAKLFLDQVAPPF